MPTMPKPITLQQWFTFLRHHRDWSHYITMLDRPGVRMLLGVWEHLVLPRVAPTEQRLRVHSIEWHEADGATFVMASAHGEHHSALVAGATQSAMRIGDGIPTIVQNVRGRMQPTFFPGATAWRGADTNMWSIENDPKSPIYAASLRTHDEIRAREAELLVCLDAGDRPSVAACADFVFGPGTIEALRGS